jgi:hypothetical protein
MTRNYVSNKAAEREGKLSTSEAAKKILDLIERDMHEKNLSEEEKNLRARRFAAFVDRSCDGRNTSQNSVSNPGAAS